MKETLNYKLKKIELTDSPPDITVHSENFDIIDAEMKKIDDKAGGAGTEVAAVQEALAAHKAESASQAHMAKNIGVEDTGGNFTSTDVEGVLLELFTSVSNGKSLVGGAITDVDDSVVIPTDPTFLELANAIGGISTGKKWASGNNYPTGGILKVRGLDFTPSFVMVKPTASNNYYSVYANMTQFGSTRNIDFCYTGGSTTESAEFNLVSSGFDIKTSNASITNYWIAFE